MSMLSPDTSGEPCYNSKDIHQLMAHVDSRHVSKPMGEMVDNVDNVRVESFGLKTSMLASERSAHFTADFQMRVATVVSRKQTTRDINCFPIERESFGRTM